MKRLTERIAYTGVLNPNMRIFDVVMRTEYGTSYNAYVVTGSEKAALVETVHDRFFDDYLEQTLEALGGRVPDCLILNHTEPDHSGSVARVLRQFPDIEIYCTKPAATYLKNIVNFSANVHPVTDGETLSLGGCGFQFITAPFLHWPDSMFSWMAEEKALFSCDFLGSHYCEPQVLDGLISYPEAYEGAIKNYYDAIFAPFAGYVRSGLEKIEGLDIEWALTGHGPVLTKDHYLGKVQSLYEEWSRPPAKTCPQIPIFYATAYGNTGRLAHAIQEGILDVLPQANCRAININEIEIAKAAELMNASDAFLIGSMTINRDAVPPIMQLLSMADAINIAKRPCAVFGTYGWSGEGVPHVAERLKSLRCSVYEEQFRVQFVPTKEDLAKAKAFGEAFGGFLGTL